MTTAAPTHPAAPLQRPHAAPPDRRDALLAALQAALAALQDQRHTTRALLLLARLLVARQDVVVAELADAVALRTIARENRRAVARAVDRAFLVHAWLDMAPTRSSLRTCAAWALHAAIDAEISRRISALTPTPIRAARAAT